MVKIKLIKGLSYYDGKISVTKKSPYAEVTPEEAAFYTACGHFSVVGKQKGTGGNNLYDDDLYDEDLFSPPEESASVISSTIMFEYMTVKELQEYAAENGIDITGCKQKKEILAKIENAQEAAKVVRAALRGE